MTDIFAGVGLAVDRPYRREIIHPGTGLVLRDVDGNAAYVDVISGDSQKARTLQQSIQSARTKLRPGQFLTAEELIAERAELMAGLTIGWNLLRLDGTPTGIAFSADVAKQLYANPSCSFWLEQATEASNVRANFIPAIPTS